MADPVRFDAAAPYEVEEQDLPFARHGGQELLARVYRPKGRAAAPLAGVVDIHGGAWSRNDRLSGALHGRALAAAGLVVASLDFRQGPDHKHPAASADVAAGVRWMRRSAGGLGVDPARIGLVGSSSGGQLALLLAVRPGMPEHAGTPIVLPDSEAGPTAGDDAVACVVALYPVCDPLARYRYAVARAKEPVPEGGFDPNRLVAAHRGYFTDEAAMAAASATRAVAAGETSARPPVWLAQPELDDNVPAEITEAFVRAYRAAGGALEHVLVPGARHGFITGAGPATDKCLPLVRDFLGRHLAG